MVTRDTVISGATIAVLGIVLTAVPVFDMWDDITREGKPPVTTVLENSPLLALGAIVVVAGVWLARSDWEATYARRIAILTVANTVGVAALIGLVLGVQWGLQNRLKPLIIAADAVLIATVGGIVIGVRSAQQQRALTDAETQRSRAQALFNNFTDAVALLSLGEGTSRVIAVNEEFEATFGFRPETVEELRATIVPDDQMSESQQIGRQLLDGSPVRREVVRKTVDRERDFILQTVPTSPHSTEVREAYAVYVDISEQKEREHQLEFLNSLLRHEIQNGLTVIRSRGQHLADTLDGREANFANTIEKRSDELAEMTDRFRAMLDALTGDVDEELASHSLSVLLEEQTDKLLDTYPSVSLRTEITDGLEVQADELLRNVVWNLLSNSVEHNDSTSPTVTVTAEERDDHVRIEIADNGPGVPDELKEAIFRRNAVSVDNEVGSGFGLFFVDKMVQRYGGDIWIEDNDPTGAIFVVTLPTP